jgi:hypothetical protein
MKEEYDAKVLERVRYGRVPDWTTGRLGVGLEQGCITSVHGTQAVESDSGKAISSRLSRHMANREVVLEIRDRIIA